MSATPNKAALPRENVGILALEIYFPSQYVDQSELEIHDQVSQGKYTVGLGQIKMGFCTDREDINSLCLTVVERLVKKHDIDYADIGRLEVGTETIIDKSKSVKSVLMQLFQDSGNTDVEGVDTTNACYGGTAALLNSIAWVESSSWDGRYALAVAGDIAVYASGSARPTGGAGAVAMLIGPNAPLVIEPGFRASHMAHAYDFYKPDLQSEYPFVDGKLSIQCYLSALDRCYKSYCQKRDKLCPEEKTTLETFDAFCFHSPYCKLVQKSLARLALNDFVHEPKDNVSPKFETLANYQDVKLEDTYFNRELEQILVALTKSVFEEKTKPCLLLSSQVGNMYTSSLYGGLISLLISRPVTSLLGQRIGMFSYGSGLASTLYSLLVTKDEAHLEPVVKGLSDVHSRLDARRKIDPKDFVATLALRQETHHKAPYDPVGDIGSLFPGTWYLMGVDGMHRRSYQRSSEDNLVNGALHD